MLDQDQIDAPQFADGAGHQNTTITATAPSPLSPVSLILTPVIMTGAVMKAMIEAQTRSSILEGIRRRQESDRRAQVQDELVADQSSPGL